MISSALPNVNTIIINQADKLGLTQLYHLRGRVGRSEERAYAYFMYEGGKKLTTLAQKRLKTIFEATELGAGYQIAMSDLEIRGTGNILGAAQSGHIEAVGFDLYTRLLSQAVKRIKEDPVPVDFQPMTSTVDLPLDAFIPEKYIGDLNSRLGIYRRLLEIESLPQIQEMQKELEDRFGEIPVPVKNLLYTLTIKVLCSRAGIRKIQRDGKQLNLYWDQDRSTETSRLQRNFGNSLKVGSSRLSIHTAKAGLHWPDILESVLHDLAK